jgi:hypothetical protein
MKGFILRIVFVCVWLVLFYLAGIFIVINYLKYDGLSAYVFASIYSILVVAGAVLITVASFNEPISK